MSRRRPAGPAFFTYGFRPFFFSAWAAAFLLVPVWVHVFLTGAGIAGPDPLVWHAHEMIFGFLSAAIAGFLLTAIPNWTGRLPVAGWRLALLFLLWLAGRGVMLSAHADDLSGAALDSAFLVIFSALVWREILAGKNWRNLPVCVMVSLLATANILFHAEHLLAGTPDYSLRLALSMVLLLISLIGGRIIPSFTTNWLIKAGKPQRPRAFNGFDKLVIGVTILALAGWTAFPESELTGNLVVVSGLLHGLRMMRWCGWKTTAEPLVFILHAAYLWMPVGLVLTGYGAIAPSIIPATMGLHALTAGAMSLMVVAVTTRATLGHTGRPLAATRPMNVAYLALFAAAIARTLAPLFTDQYPAGLSVSAALWSFAFLVLVVYFAPMIFRPRP
ncbi:NnrS family protein [Gimibacter soli]|uniref:NnrS family protein n=1 Tax=Gimibacter soli TaxID=3024400 RepID=A0AAE9XVE1_9PROT|nr:NnrS family protein [Gimibacter soli]WCL55565.1 NnrS family protein [Gimibacter soli]